MKAGDYLHSPYFGWVRLVRKCASLWVVVFVSRGHEPDYIGSCHNLTQTDHEGRTYEQWVKWKGMQ